VNIRDIALFSLWIAPFAPFMLVEEAAAVPVAQSQAVTLIRVVTQSDETLYLNPDTVYELPMVVDEPVVLNGLTLPAGTVINGRLEPAEGGLRYITTEIEAGGLRTPVTATSDILHDVKDPRETSGGAIATDAAIGAAGGAVLGAILGDGVSLGEVIGGAATGVIVGNTTAQRVVVLESGTPIILQTE